MSTMRQDRVMQPADAYLAHLTAIGHPKTTIDTYRCALRRASIELPAGLLSVHDEIEQWLATRRASSTRNVYRAALRGFYEYALRRGMISENPAADLAPIKRRTGLPRPVPLDQLAHILENAAEPERLWYTVAAYAGARCCEIARLDRADVDEHTIYLHGKGDRERLVPTHPMVWAAVRDLPQGPLAGGRNAAAVSSRGNRRLDRLGLPAVTMHRLRHTAGTLWQAAVGDTRVTQQLLGHASLQTVQIYTAVSDTSMRAAVLAMPSITVGAATAADAGSEPGAAAPPPPR